MKYKLQICFEHEYKVRICFDHEIQGTDGL